MMTIVQRNNPWPASSAVISTPYFNQLAALEVTGNRIGGELRAPVVQVVEHPSFPLSFFTWCIAVLTFLEINLIFWRQRRANRKQRMINAENEQYRNKFHTIQQQMLRDARELQKKFDDR